MDAVDQRAHWADVLGAWAWLIALFELDLLFWLGVARGCEALLS